ncbi:hypothetical protein EXD76_04560, partial [BEV proteobacterium]|nr:hypothetical protein [Candidatus Symbiopectobacterium sp. Chty_BC]
MSQRIGPDFLLYSESLYSSIAEPTIQYAVALLNKSELVTTVPYRVYCYVMRILFVIPNSVI